MNSPEWRISDGAVPYDEALATMEARVADIRAGQADEMVWLLEHPPLYTAGTSARTQDLLQPARFPVHVAGRGGQYTYHGPGQRVAYVMLDLRARRQDVRRYVSDLEEWTIRTLGRFNVRAERREGRVGVWVVRPDKPPCPTAARARTRSRPSACASATGWRSTASRSTSSRTFRTMRESFPAASPTMASRRWSISACR